MHSNQNYSADIICEYLWSLEAAKDSKTWDIDSDDIKITRQVAVINIATKLIAGELACHGSYGQINIEEAMQMAKRILKSAESIEHPDEDVEEVGTIEI
tara:strand:- start:366 stop:662 length:297 start_codon:yes stop_codon:yes gene_type:complete